MDFFDKDITTHNFPEREIVQKRFNDLDGLRHVNNGVQQSYFDIGRANYLKRIYGEKFYCNDRVLLVASYKTDFIAQIRLEDNVEVCTSVYHLGNKSLRMIQVIRGTEDGRIYTKSDSVMVAIETKEGKSIVIPEEWRKKIEEIEK
ncbi:MAG: thioesterase family protein [Bacteroidales bacterium]|nr:thioesterase family protein [Bacteroidales bacterium]